MGMIVMPPLRLNTAESKESLERVPGKTKFF